MVEARKQIPSEVLEHFWPGKTLKSLRIMQMGLVHYSAQLEFENGKYLLQKINTSVFKKADIMVQNMVCISDQLMKDTGYNFAIPKPVSDSHGEYLIHDETGCCWRCMEYIEHYEDYIFKNSPETAFQVAMAFGKFDAALASIDPAKIIPTIESFHDPVFRLQQFDQARNSMTSINGREVKELNEKILQHRWIAQEMTEFNFPVRLAHNDAKPSNVLFSSVGKPLAIIDLDTVMPGTPLHDFGDMVRSMASTVTEDHPVMEEVSFSKQMYDALESGFIEGAGDSLEKIEKEHLLLGAKYIIFEQAVRFFTDYLNGNIYYKVKDDQHNMVRAQNQLALLDSLSKIMD